MNPIEDLIRPLTSDEVLERFLQILEDAKVPARSWRKAGALRTILRVASIVYSDFTVLMAAAIRGGFLDLAEGNWLTALAKYVYGVERKPATFATGKVRFKNTGGGSFAPGDYPAGSVRVYSSETKKAYLNAEPLSLGAFETKLVGIIAVEQGADSAAAPETIRSRRSCSESRSSTPMPPSARTRRTTRISGKPAGTSSPASPASGLAASTSGPFVRHGGPMGHPQTSTALFRRRHRRRARSRSTSRVRRELRSRWTSMPPEILSRPSRVRPAYASTSSRLRRLPTRGASPCGCGELKESTRRRSRAT